MVNYQLGKIYRLVCNVTGLVYIGSTCDTTLARRLVGHRNAYKRYQNGKCGYMTSITILENNNYEIFLIEDYPCDRKEQLHARERHFIEQNECVNKAIPNRTHKEYYIDNKDVILEKHKEYYIDNKDVILEYSKAYYNDNKDVISEQRKAHYNDNKDVILEQKKAYYNDNKNVILEQKKAYQIANKQKISERRKKAYREDKALNPPETA